MFGKTHRLFDLLGIPIRIDTSWFFIAALVTWSLAGAVFPERVPGLAGSTYVALGVAGAVGLFASIVLHELCHSIVARGLGVPIRGITLFIFGGVAEMEREPPTASAELRIAIAGPLGSATLAVAGGLAQGVVISLDGPPAALALAWYLGLVNAGLALFNLVPAFPLDGGRILRAILWMVRGRLGWATRVASSIGAGFGFFLVAIGVSSIVLGDLVGGIWWAMIGIFLRTASRSAVRQLAIRRALEGEPVRRFMKTDVVAVDPSTSIAALVDDYLHRHHHEVFPVVRDGEVAGAIHMKRVRGVPREQWAATAVGELADPATPDTTIGPDEDAVEAIGRMSRTGTSRLLVVEEGRLVGILALKDLLSFLSLKIELEA